MQKRLIFFSLFFCFTFIQLNPVTAQDVIRVTSSPNPVGSGARAVGMGGAFIAVADDATAASWNPGGLAQLKKPEISLVGTWFNRIEEDTLGTMPESNGTQRSESNETQRFSEADINYFSIAYPFNFLERNMVISLNYQYLYDFTRAGSFSVKTLGKSETEILEADTLEADTLEADTLEVESLADFQEDGGLSALGLAYCIQVTPDFSFGFTLNFWDQSLFNNTWTEKVHTRVTQTMKTDPEEDIGPSITVTDDYTRWNRYDFSGFNANFGIRWRISDKLTLGAVLKTPFTADLTHETTTDLTHETSTEKKQLLPDGQEIRNTTPSVTHDEELDMPMSYGIGLAYRFSDIFTMSADVYRTEWDDFIRTDSAGNEVSPITQRHPDESDIDPTHQVRVGAEYLFISPNSDYVIPLRGGVFYDPAPAAGSPDDFYGFSLGSGIAKGRYVFDIAFQCRFGKDVSESTIQYLSFSQDAQEYMIYSSLIVHF